MKIETKRTIWPWPRWDDGLDLSDRALTRCSPREQGICNVFIKPQTISGADVDSVL